MRIRFCAAILVATGLSTAGPFSADADNSCPKVWNTVDRIADRQLGVILRQELRVGIQSEAEAVASHEAVIAEARAAGLNADVTFRSLLEGPDCNGDQVVDGYEHIFLDGAPVGFSPEDWAVARTARSDPFMAPLREGRAEAPE